MGECIAKYIDELPKFFWSIQQVGKKRKIIIENEEVITDSILRVAKKNKELKQRKLVEKAFVVKGRVPSVKPVVLSASTDLVLQWEDIRFYNGYFVFRPNLEGKVRVKNIEPLRVNNFKCRASFNYIIKYFKARLPKITYHITPDYKIELDNNPDFDMVLIDLAKEQMRLDNAIEVKHVAGTIHKLSFAEATSKGKKMTKEDFKKYKSQFIDFLVDHQTNAHKVVPITESVSHRGTMHNEEGFIFTVKSGIDSLLLIVENVNPDRATMLFKVNEWHYRVALHTIFDYVQSDAVNKRSAIRDQRVSFREAGVRYHWTSNHDSFHDWKVRMLNDFR